MIARARLLQSCGLVGLVALLTQAGCGGAVETSSTDDHSANAVSSAVARTLPCEPRRVLETVCQQCHSDPPKNGAPYPLRDLSDIVAMRDGDPVYTLMIAELEARRMPLTPVTITEGDRSVLLDWLREDAPAVTPRVCP